MRLAKAYRSHRVIGLVTLSLVGVALLPIAHASALPPGRGFISPAPYPTIVVPAPDIGPVPDGSGDGGTPPTTDRVTIPDSGGAGTSPGVTTSDASGGGATVKVTARVSEQFALTVHTSGELPFGEVEVGRHYSLDHIPLMRVESNRPWVLTDSSDNVIEDLAGKDWERWRILRHEPSPRFNQPLLPGVYEVACGYLLDLSNPGLRGLPEGTVIATNMGYTVIQQ